MRRLSTRQLRLLTLNESPSEKEGKYPCRAAVGCAFNPLNESPSEKEGKLRALRPAVVYQFPSMKVPPKRKGNRANEAERARHRRSLNESPSEKEGK